jgi:hypothetical protein
MKSTQRAFWITLTGGMMLLAPAFAQRADTYRAQIRGGGGDRGKCTIEVEVDGVAEIEIRGDQGSMRTLSGNPSSWRRMECNQPLPSNPYDFRFSGVDGRGRQTLLRDPSNNRGVAVVRIEDPQGGREGYTFDIEWRGTSGYSSGGDRGPGVDRGPGGDRGPDGDRGGPRWNDEVRFRGRGDGVFNNFRGPDDRLYDCEVTVDRRGEVSVTFQTERRSRLTFNGRLVRFDRDSIFADMSGMGVRGSMQIRYNGRDRVSDINMSASGRERFELRWHR